MPLAICPRGTGGPIAAKRKNQKSQKFEISKSANREN
jgi:hypothetical protein